MLINSENFSLQIEDNLCTLFSPMGMLRLNYVDSRLLSTHYLHSLHISSMSSLNNERLEEEIRMFLEDYYPNY